MTLFFFIWWHTFGLAAPAPDVTWTMVNVNSTQNQADAHFIHFRSGVNILIDVGRGGDGLVPFLKVRRVKKIHHILITHAHKDHYGALTELMDSKIAIEKVWMNIPSRRACDNEIPWGCDYGHVQSIRARLVSKGVQLSSATPGTFIYQDAMGGLKILYAYNADATPVGLSDINDESVIAKLFYKNISALFTGDLNSGVGRFLSLQGEELRADLLKVPHHGTEGVAPNAFFDRVAPKVALVPSPKGLWLSERSRRIKDYFESKKIPTYVNGIHGNVRVEFQNGDYKILTELPTSSIPPSPMPYLPQSTIQ